MDYLVVMEADDGTWYDEGKHAVGLIEARRVAQKMTPPRGYGVVIYRLEYVEAFDGEMIGDSPSQSPIKG